MTETSVLLDVVRLVAGISILSYASYTDMKTRRASNMLWILIAKKQTVQKIGKGQTFLKSLLLIMTNF